MKNSIKLILVLVAALVAACGPLDTDFDGGDALKSSSAFCYHGKVVVVSAHNSSGFAFIDLDMDGKPYPCEDEARR